MNDLLKQRIRAAIGQAAGQGRIIRPQVTAIQVVHGEALLAKVLSGAPVRLATPPWALEYEANALPSASSPAWTKVQTNDAWGQMWYDAAWAYRLQVVVDGTKVPGALTDFPVYLSGANFPASFFANCKADGSDIRVCSGDGATLLSSDLVHFNQGAQTMELHVLRSLAATPIGTRLAVYYGNAAATLPVATGVWATNYLAVHHLGEALGASFGDATGHGYTGTNNISPGAKAGALFATGGDTFDGTNDWVNTSGAADLAAGLGGLAAATFSFWVKRASIGNQQVIGLLFTGGQGKVTLQFSATDKVTIQGRGASTDTSRIGTTTPAITDTAGWHLVHAAMDIANDLMYFWIDGVSAAYTGVMGWTATAFSGEAGAATSSIGAAYQGGAPRLAGLLDEVRIRRSVLTDNWVTAEYNNQSSPSTFYTVGSPESYAASILHIVDGV